MKGCTGLPLKSCPLLACLTDGTSMESPARHGRHSNAKTTGVYDRFNDDVRAARSPVVAADGQAEVQNSHRPFRAQGRISVSITDS